MKNLNKKGFTLIELLVVITIIGILATGATATYTSQIQKARDTTRINDMKAVQAGVEQFYQDSGVYPPLGTSFSGVLVYTPKLPQDPKSSQASSKSSFDYYYNVGADSNSIVRQQYELSTHFENSGNLSGKAQTDGGSDQYRLEIGIGISTINTNQTGTRASSLLKYSCNATDGTAASCTADGSSSHSMLIRN